MDARFDEIAEGILPAEYDSYPRTQLATSTYSLDTDHNEKLYCSIYRVYHSDGHKYILNQLYSDGVENSIHIAEIADTITELGTQVTEQYSDFNNPEIWSSLYTHLFNQVSDAHFSCPPTTTEAWRELYNLAPVVYTDLVTDELQDISFTSIYPCGDNEITVTDSETVSLFGGRDCLKTVACTMGQRAIANGNTVISLGVEPFYTDSYQELRYDMKPTDDLKALLDSNSSLHLISDTKDVSKKQLTSFLESVLEFEMPVTLLLYLPEGGLLEYIEESVYDEIANSELIGLIWYRSSDIHSDAEVDWVIELPELTPDSVTISADSTIIDPSIGGTCATDSELTYYRKHPIETEMFEYLSVSIHNRETNSISSDIVNYVI